MRKIKLLIMLGMFCSILAGCSEEVSNTLKINKNVLDYNGAPITIGVIRMPETLQADNVQFEEVNTKDFWEREELDGLFFFDEDFQKLSQSEFAEVFNSIDIPTFFIGMEKPFFVFLNEERSYHDVPVNKASGYVQGFVVNKDDIRTTWEIHIEDNSNLSGVYSQLFNIIEENKISHR